MPAMDFLVHHLLRTRVHRVPDQEALVDGHRRLSYGEVGNQVDRLAGALADLGVGRFDRVGVQLAASVEQVVALFGTSAVGGVFVPIHTSLVPRQVAHIATDCQLKVLVTQISHWQRLQAEFAELPSLEHVVLTDGAGASTGASTGVSNGATPAVHSLSELTAASFRPPACAGVDRDLAAILYTSGSTGLPKGVMLSHANLVAGASIVSDYLSLGQRDRILAVLPFSFDAGLNQLTTAFQQGATLVLLSFVLANQIVRSLRTERITGLAGVPTLWNLLAQSHSFQTASLPDLRYITNTGGSLPRSTLTQLRRVLPTTEIFLMYGLTEAFRSTYLPPSDLDRCPGSIGKAIPNTEILVIDDAGQTCESGQVGELVHHGPTVSLGYWNQPELTGRVLRPHPFPPPGGAIPPLVCYSGDLVYADEDGFLYFVARKDNQIKSSGFRVSPTEVESILYEHGGVLHAAVVGVPDELLGEAIHALVVSKPATAVSEGELREHCASRLPNYLVPKHITFHCQLPMTSSGKLDYARLREIACELSTADDAVDRQPF
jgi:acyl-CoA ligase (AMP-forming) (exosortase A-associated)